MVSDQPSEFRHARRVPRAGLGRAAIGAIVAVGGLVLGPPSSAAQPADAAHGWAVQALHATIDVVRERSDEAAARADLTDAITRAETVLAGSSAVALDPAQPAAIATATLSTALTHAQAALLETSGSSAEELQQQVATLTEAADAAETELGSLAGAAFETALTTAQAQLAAWEPIAADPTRLDALRAAITAAQALEPSASATDRLACTADLIAQTAALPTVDTSTGVTTIGGIVVANKTIGLPSDYAPGLLPEVTAAFQSMKEAAAADGISLWIDSGYRSYADQRVTYQGYVSKFSSDYADRFSSRPGHSEHQTGLAIDVNDAHPNFATTAAAGWLAEHAPEFGFVVRYPDGKEDITGYRYEPWHLRYLGIDLATELTASGLTLEEYLGITSHY